MTTAVGEMLPKSCSAVGTSILGWGSSAGKNGTRGPLLISWIARKGALSTISPCASSAITLASCESATYARPTARAMAANATTTMAPIHRGIGIRLGEAALVGPFGRAFGFRLDPADLERFLRLILASPLAGLCNNLVDGIFCRRYGITASNMIAPSAIIAAPNNSLSVSACSRSQTAHALAVTRFPAAVRITTSGRTNITL